MKKAVLLLSLIAAGSTALFSGDRFIVSVGGTFFAPADERYKIIYGKTHFLPDIRAAVRVSDHFFLGIEYGILAAQGTIPESEDRTESRLSFLSISLGYRTALHRRVDVRVELGRETVNYQEKAWGEEKSGSSSALRIGGGIDYSLSKLLFAALSFNYSNPDSTIDAETIRLGGLKAGASLGLRF